MKKEARKTKARQAVDDHGERRSSLPKPDARQQTTAFRIAAVLCLVLALWMGWNGWQQYAASRGDQALRDTRDAVVGDMQSDLSKQLDKLRAQLATPSVQSALARGDRDAAGKALAVGWNEATATQVATIGFDAAYAGLPDTGYGRVAALEAALVGNAAVANIARIDGQPSLLLTAPARAGDVLAGVALVRLPLDTVTSALAAAGLDSSNYLALRQGSHTLLARGDQALAEGAEALSVAVADSRLRVVAARPEAPSAPFGLGMLGCLIAAAALVALAAVLAWLARGRQRTAAREQAEQAEQGPDQTLTDFMQSPDSSAPAQDDEAGRLAVAAATGAAVAGEAHAAAEDTPDSNVVDAGIFRAYDIRGVVGETLDREVAELIGRSIGQAMRDRDLTDIVVGRDGRLSGPDLIEGLIRGLRRAGCNVTDIGMAPTPVIYFAAFHLDTGSCVSLTGSHNPPNYNGFKIVLGGETLSGDAITALYDTIARGQLQDAAARGSFKQTSVDDDYIQRIASDVQLDRRLRVVVDAGNGVAGEIAPQVLDAIGVEVVPLYCVVDGTFPNHHPDPSEPKNLVDLIETVQRRDADLGIAFDGDGDRLGVVTRDGNNIFADRLLMLFAADVLERNPGAMIIFDVKCTGRLPGEILRHGGSPLMWKTGHSLVKAKMRETGAELAGEMSGHFFFKERWYGFDDGIYAAARLLEILAANPSSPSDVLNALPAGVSTPEIKVDAPEGDPHAFVEQFREAAQFEGARRSTIDGLRVDWPDGWGLVRASNTTPVLVLRFDADSKEALARIQEDFRNQLLALRPDLSLPF